MAFRFSATSGRGQGSGGFTLMEMLVVLVLVSMTMTLLMQGLSYVYSLRSRILVQIDEQRVSRLRDHLLTNLILTLTPDGPEGDGIFAGNSSGFHGLSLLSLQGEVGAPALVRLWTETAGQQRRLLYRQNGWEEMELGNWSAAPELIFRYQDDEGRDHTDWPPRSGSYPQLPSAVLVQVGDGLALPTWFVPILARKQPRANLQSVFEQ